MAAVFRPARRSRGRSSGGSRRRSSGTGTEWILTSHLLSLSPTVPHTAVLLVPNEIINFMTSPTYLGGHFDVLAQAIVSTPDGPGQGFVNLGVRALPLRSFDSYIAQPDLASVEIPLPWSDGEGSWAYHRSFYVTAGNIDLSTPTAATEHSLVSAARFHDIARSARRLNTDEVLALVAELSGTSVFPQSGTICLAITARVLLKEK